MLGEPKLWLFPNRYLMKSLSRGKPYSSLAGVWGQARSRNFFENKTPVVADGAVR